MNGGFENQNRRSLWYIVRLQGVYLPIQKILGVHTLHAS
jgi:hypothetical protein